VSEREKENDNQIRRRRGKKRIHSSAGREKEERESGVGTEGGGVKMLLNHACSYENAVQAEDDKDEKPPGRTPVTKAC